MFQHLQHTQKKTVHIYTFESHFLVHLANALGNCYMLGCCLVNVTSGGHSPFGWKTSDSLPV